MRRKQTIRPVDAPIDSVAGPRHVIDRDANPFAWSGIVGPEVGSCIVTVVEDCHFFPFKGSTPSSQLHGGKNMPFQIIRIQHPMQNELDSSEIGAITTSTPPGFTRSACISITVSTSQ